MGRPAHSYGAERRHEDTVISIASHLAQPFTKEDVIAATGLTPRTVDKALAHLYLEGRIARKHRVGHPSEYSVAP